MFFPTGFSPLVQYEKQIIILAEFLSYMHSGLQVEKNRYFSQELSISHNTSRGNSG